MALIAFNKGVQEMLKRILNYSATGNVYLKLYRNNLALAETTAVADFTEANFTGYAAIALNGATFTITDADPSVASYPQQEFISSAGSQNQLIYGYYITNFAGTIALWAEAFTDGPYNIVNNGDKVKVTPTINLD